MTVLEYVIPQKDLACGQVCVVYTKASAAFLLLVFPVTDIV
jgi:hypothetical protein